MGKKAAAVARGAITVAAGVKTVSTAVRERVRGPYHITWLDENGVTIDTTEVPYNAIPDHEPPVKESAGGCDYEFGEWYPARKPATKDTVYRARFLEKRNADAHRFRFYNHVTDENTCFVTYYTDDYFRTPSSGYDPSMTTFALFLALSSGNKADDPIHNADYAVELMKDIGCATVDVNDYYYLEKKEIDNIGVAVGIKYADIPTVFILIRGSHYGAEFGGNLLVGPGDGEHLGFSLARQRAMDFIVSVLKKNEVSGRVRMMTTGYSRGGAVSNLVASAITDMIIDGTVEEKLGVSVIQDDMYGFCFEPALCQYDDSNRSEIYRNIVCVIDPNDIVAKVPPVLFGFTVYGRIYWLKSNDEGSVNIMLRYMDKYFGEGMSDFYNVVSYVPQSDQSTLGKMLDTILHKAVTTFGDRERYVRDLQDTLVYTVYSIIDNLDAAKKAFATLDPTNKKFEDLMPVLFSREPLIKRISRHMEEFNILTDTDPKRMRPIITQLYDLIKKSRPEDVIASFMAIRHNYKRMFTPHYPMGPICYLLSEDPNYSA